MARIAGVDLPREKRVEIGLTYIYGIGRVVSNRLLNEAGVSPDTRVKDLTDDEVARIQKAIETLEVPVEGDLRREIALNIKRLQEILMQVLRIQLQQHLISMTALVTHIRLLLI